MRAEAIVTSWSPCVLEGILKRKERKAGARVKERPLAGL